MKKMYYSIIIALAIGFVALGVYAVNAHTQLKEYKGDIQVKGTYASDVIIDANGDFERVSPSEDVEYLVLTDEKDEEGFAFEIYKQNEETQRGIYTPSDYPEVYIFNEVGQELCGDYMIAKQGSVIILKDNVMTQFTKIDEKAVYVNTGSN